MERLRLIIMTIILTFILQGCSAYQTPKAEDIKQDQPVSQSIGIGFNIEYGDEAIFEQTIRYTCSNLRSDIPFLTQIAKIHVDDYSIKADLKINKACSNDYLHIKYDDQVTIEKKLEKILIPQRKERAENKRLKEEKRIAEQKAKEEAYRNSPKGRIESTTKNIAIISACENAYQIDTEQAELAIKNSKSRLIITLGTDFDDLLFMRSLNRELKNNIGDSFFMNESANLACNMALLAGLKDR